jgi:hypothetical protein
VTRKTQVTGDTDEHENGRRVLIMADKVIIYGKAG